MLGADVGRDDVLLAVDDESVEKWAFASWLARECLAADDCSAATRRLQTSKRCSNDRLRELGYEFAHPTFRERYRPTVDSYRD